MVLDVIFLLLIIFAFYSGFKQGIISSVLTFLGVFLGVIIALNFSTFVSIYLVKNFNLPEIIIPALSFVVVLLVVLISLKTVAFIAQKVLQTISLNIVNKLAGGLLFAMLGAFVFSVLFSFIDNFAVLTEALKTESQVYPFVSSFGPQIFKTASNFIPICMDIYKETNEVFKTAAENL